MSCHSIAALLQQRTEALSLIKPRASPGHSSEAGVEREAWRLQARVSSLSEWMCSRQPFRLLQPHFSFTSRCHQLGQAPKRSSRRSQPALGLCPCRFRLVQLPADKRDFRCLLISAVSPEILSSSISASVLFQPAHTLKCLPSFPSTSILSPPSLHPPLLVSLAGSTSG